MTAGSWVTYYQVSELVGDGTIDLDAASHFRVVLVSSSYTPSRSHTAWSDISTYEKATAYGYTQGGYGITQTWNRVSATTTFDSDDPTWTVTGSALAARYAVLMHDADGNGTLAAGDIPIAYVLLDTTPADYSVSPGSNLVLQINSSGYFNITDA